MDNLILSVNVVLPLFLLLAAGYLLKLFKLLDAHTLSAMNQVCFKVFLPILLFLTIYQSDLKQVWNPKLLLFAIVSIFLYFLLLCIFVPLSEKKNSRRGVLIQAMFRSNFILFGIPVASSIYGPEALAPVSMLITVVVPLYNVLAVIVLEFFRGGKINFGKVLFGICKNPLILAAILGLLALYFKVPLPKPIVSALSDLSDIATPLALLILGGTFSFRKITGYTRQLIIGLCGKLILMPLLFLPVAVLLGFRNEELVGLMTMFGTPSAVSSFVMAEQMGGDSELAGQLVIFTTAFSIFTLFTWVFLLKHFALI